MQLPSAATGTNPPTILWPDGPVHRVELASTPGSTSSQPDCNPPHTEILTCSICAFFRVNTGMMASMCRFSTPSGTGRLRMISSFACTGRKHVQAAKAAQSSVMEPNGSAVLHAPQAVRCHMRQAGQPHTCARQNTTSHPCRERTNGWQSGRNSENVQQSKTSDTTRVVHCCGSTLSTATPGQCNSSCVLSASGHAHLLLGEVGQVVDACSACCWVQRLPVRPNGCLPCCCCLLTRFDDHVVALLAPFRTARHTLCCGRANRSADTHATHQAPPFRQS